MGMLRVAVQGHGRQPASLGVRGYQCSGWHACRQSPHNRTAVARAVAAAVGWTSAVGARGACKAVCASALAARHLA